MGKEVKAFRSRSLNPGCSWLGSCQIEKGGLLGAVSDGRVLEIVNLMALGSWAVMCSWCLALTCNSHGAGWLVVIGWVPGASWLRTSLGGHIQKALEMIRGGKLANMGAGDSFWGSKSDKRGCGQIHSSLGLILWGLEWDQGHVTGEGNQLLMTLLATCLCFLCLVKGVWSSAVIELSEKENNKGS